MSKKMINCKTCGAKIAASARSCPHCGARNTFVNPANTIAAVLLVVVFSFFILKLVGITSGDSPESDIEKPELSVSSIALWAAYSDNKVSADNTYKGKWIAVNGTISDISQDIVSKAPCVALDTGDSMNLYPIECFFSGDDEAQNEILASLKDGQEITIVGKCEGTPILRVQLSNCHF